MLWGENNAKTLCISAGITDKFSVKISDYIIIIMILCKRPNFIVNLPYNMRKWRFIFFSVNLLKLGVVFDKTKSIYNSILFSFLINAKFRHANNIFYRLKSFFREFGFLVFRICDLKSFFHQSQKYAAYKQRFLSFSNLSIVADIIVKIAGKFI